MNTVRKGVANEYRVVLALLDAGYDVFYNIMPVGEVDLMAMKGGEVSRIQVKTARKNDALIIDSATAKVETKYTSVDIIAVVDEESKVVTFVEYEGQTSITVRK